jgi:hypothetical protein
VTMATRPCKSSRSCSGEIVDVALPMASRGIERERRGKLCQQHVVRQRAL